MSNMTVTLNVPEEFYAKVQEAAYRGVRQALTDGPVELPEEPSEPAGEEALTYDDLRAIIKNKMEVSKTPESTKKAIRASLNLAEGATTVSEVPKGKIGEVIARINEVS